MKQSLPSIQFALLIHTACRPAIIPTPTPEAISECFLHRKVQVWQDVDGDGVLNLGEPPVVGVSVVIKPSSTSNRTFIGQTGPDGIAEITVPRDYSAPTPGPINLAGLPADESVKFPLVPPNPTAAS